jgi:hypothetical protein
MKWSGLLTVVSVAASAADLGLTLPPSSGWSERKDPHPLPSVIASSRYFVRTGDTNVTLRLVTDPSLRLDYSATVVNGLAARVATARPAVKVSQMASFPVAGISVGTLTLSQSDLRETVFYLPADRGDCVVTLTGKDPAASAEVLTMVNGATGLRGPDEPGSGMGIMGGMAVMFMVVLSVLLFSMRRKC